MTQVNIHEAKVHLSRYVDMAVEGETVILCRRNVPIAEIRALHQRTTAPRPEPGAFRGMAPVPDAFFEPLPDELLAAFEGEAAAGEPAVGDPV